MWGGGFSEGPAEVLWDFTVDDSDHRLLFDDLAGSLAHVTMLGRTGTILTDEAGDIADGLRCIKAEAESGEFVFEPGDEDVHSAVERRLYELIGDVAGKLHTGRSRNDQVALDVRLYLRRAAGQRIADLLRFADLLVRRGEETAHTIVPSYTHLQQAQPSTLGHHLLAYGWMALRDAKRFGEVRSRLDVSPLGAGAAVGSGLPLDPQLVASELGFSTTFENSLDAVGSRDVPTEYVFCCAQTMASLSRLAEEVILWSSAEFGWITVADAFATGSSAMPQKKNPDVAELVRGRAASVAADLATMLGIQKGTPLAYNRDLQEDKRAIFHADDTVAAAVVALGGLLATADFHPPPPHPATLALDVAEALVRKGIPFREAHAAVGELVAEHPDPSRASPEQLRAVHPLLEPADVPSVEDSVGARLDVGEQATRLRAAIEGLS
jgi:argininosuccinate lyase